MDGRCVAGNEYCRSIGPYNPEMQFSFIARGQQQPQHLTINIECSQLSSLLLAHSQYAGVTWN